MKTAVLCMALLLCLATAAFAQSDTKAFGILIKIYGSTCSVEAAAPAARVVSCVRAGRRGLGVGWVAVVDGDEHTATCNVTQSLTTPQSHWECHFVVNLIVRGDDSLQANATDFSNKGSYTAFGYKFGRDVEGHAVAPWGAFFRCARSSRFERRFLGSGRVCVRAW